MAAIHRIERLVVLDERKPAVVIRCTVPLASTPVVAVLDAVEVGVRAVQLEFAFA